MIDTHAHLDALDDPADAVARAGEAGVTRIVTIGTDPTSWAEMLPIVEHHEGVYGVAGVHPHAAESGADLETLERLLSHPKVVALGEIGLDYYRDYAPREAQTKLFIYQLGLAKRARLPVVIHNRAADEDMIAILRQWFDGTVVMHCFSSPPLLAEAVERGWYVSFAGNVTYANADDLRAAARAVPAELILAETDCPYLAPQPVRGKTNEPAYVVHTVNALAEARGVAADALAAQIDANATKAFGLP
ncbi:MAG: TatD DNase family protein [Gaiellaceae bacterium]|nr:TatD DNase family protein [Gaiellaceae bacterium]